MKKFFTMLTAIVLSCTFIGAAACSSSDAGGFAPSKGDDAYLGEGGEGGGENIPSQAGVLTAGEWKDLENLDFWTKLLRENDWYKLMEERSLFADEISVVWVKDEEENPCFNAVVELLDESKTVLYTAVTDVTGYACLPYDIDNQDKTPLTVRVAGAETPILEDVTTVTLNSGGKDVTALDLMLTVDTTGSMSDELEYLKVELEDVVKRVSESANGILSINVSVNFYRDTGDDYVIKPFEFSADVSKVVANLRAQSASGGGDTPEAVHTALKNSVSEHQWRANAVKLLFLVLDAPPHSEKEIQGINAQLKETVIEAAKQGIRVIPVASSGVDTQTEFLMRSYAVMTGGTYIFLTNHSGIGNDHLEPTIGEYQVEALNNCLVRVIKEYCGLQKRAEKPTTPESSDSAESTESTEASDST